MVDRITGRIHFRVCINKKGREKDGSAGLEWMLQISDTKALKLGEMQRTTNTLTLEHPQRIIVISCGRVMSCSRDPAVSYGALTA